MNVSATGATLRPLFALARTPFVRNVATVASGTAVAQAITFAFYPVITRVYGPDAFGILGVFMSAVAILTPATALAFPTAIVLPKSDADANGLIRLSLLIAVVSASTCAFLLTVFSDRIVVLFGLHRIAPFLLLLPAIMLFQAMQDVAQQWLIRTRQFSLTAKVVVLQALLFNGAKVGFGLLQPFASTLILVSAMGFALQSAMLAIGIRWATAPRDEVLATGYRSSLAQLARTYRDFPLFRAAHELLNALSQGLPVILLAAFYGPAIAGLYGLAYSVLAAPTMLLGNSVGNVLYPRLAEAANSSEELRRLVLRPTCALFFIGTVPFGMIMAFGPHLFALVFGEEWHEAGEYARWLALWMLFGFSNVPSTKAAPIIQAQGALLVFGISSLAARLISMILPQYLSEGPQSAMIYMSVSGALLNASLIAATQYKLKYRRSER